MENLYNDMEEYGKICQLYSEKKQKREKQSNNINDVLDEDILWMYETKEEKEAKEQEEFLLGKKIDMQKLMEEEEEAKKEIIKQKNNIDHLNKIREDPLTIIKQMEIQRKKMLDNQMRFMELHRSREMPYGNVLNRQSCKSSDNSSDGEGVKAKDKEKERKKRKKEKKRMEKIKKEKKREKIKLEKKYNEKKERKREKRRKEKRKHIKDRKEREVSSDTESEIEKKKEMKKVRKNNHSSSNELLKEKVRDRLTHSKRIRGESTESENRQNYHRPLIATSKRKRESKSSSRHSSVHRSFRRRDISNYNSRDQNGKKERNWRMQWEKKRQRAGKKQIDLHSDTQSDMERERKRRTREH
ncbi:hypothetical protein, conserved [Plasmodium gonderi]|uniref:Pre-mRNA splicing factor n=1 Tax=Plasmodium gonderi TaxID=77519 RepID=A0A1Y1JAB6_PLAGO|nr:hypothetical protein, conserved [Plasmodium gonderi]GAW79210.1 hypothetical protein, conserved [Plasmodium gonderi]